MRVHPVDRRTALLDQVAGEQDVDVVDPHDRVTVGVAAAGMRELHLPVAEVEDADGGEGVVGDHDLGLEDLVAARVVGGLVVPLLDPLAGVDRARGGLLVRVDGHAAEGFPEGAVAEGVVEVLMGVEDRGHRTDPERAYVVHDRARRPARGLGVDDQQPVRTTDQTHVQVEPLLPGHPHPVGHLSESRHAGEPSKVGTPGW